jgi:ribosomal-protein-alanine acetyltransferase
MGVSRNWSADQVMEELHRERATVLISEDRGCLHGWLVTWRVPPDEIHVLEVAISPQYRRRGFGSALLLEAMSAGSRGGAVVAMLEVRATNAAAIEMYKKLGYYEVGRRPRYYSDGEDALLMNCNITDISKPTA